LDDVFTIHNKKFEDVLLRIAQPITYDNSLEDYYRMAEDEHKYAMYQQAISRALRIVTQKRGVSEDRVRRTVEPM
jgi:hypothetical protein